MKTQSRREFLAQAAAAAAAAALLPQVAWGYPPNGPPGLQLYSVGEPLKKDVSGTLQRVHAIGYREVETAGFVGLNAKQFRHALDTAGLRCHSSHILMKPSDFAGAFDDAHTVGARYIVSPVLVLEDQHSGGNKKSLYDLKANDYKRFAATANRTAERAKQAGLQYAYHNHDYEFLDLGQGQTGYDILLQETDPELVKFELDCGWMAYAGRNPVDYFRKYPNRYRMIHVKEFVRGTRKWPATNFGMEGTELGRGAVDYKPIFAAARKIDIQYYYVEQEPPFSNMAPLQAVKVDFDYLRSLD